MISIYVNLTLEENSIIILLYQQLGAFCFQIRNLDYFDQVNY